MKATSQKCALYGEHNPYFSGISLAITIDEMSMHEFEKSQSLFYWKLPCNHENPKKGCKFLESQSLFYWKLPSMEEKLETEFCKNVTILILLESPLKWLQNLLKNNREGGHNPYFTGISLAIKNAISYRDFLKKSQSLFYWKLPCNRIPVKTQE